MVDASIIIVNWNTKDLLLNCLKSIKNREAKYEMEIIVVDNASTDGSPEAVKYQFPNVKLIVNNRNLGFAKGNNIGIEASLGRYVCLANSDIVIKEGCIEGMLRYMDAHTSIGILGPKLLNPDLTLQPSCKKFPTLWNNFCLAVGLTKIFLRSKLFCGEHMWFFPHDTVIRVEALVGAFLVVRREAIKQVGLLDENFFMYGEEIDWCKRFWNAGWEVVFYPEAEVVHYGRASSSREPVRFFKESYRSKLKYWKKHRSRVAQIGFVLITLLRQAIRIMSGVFLYIMKPSARTKVMTKIKGSFDVIVLVLPSSIK